MTEFQKFLDDFCYENFDCSIVALTHGGGVIPSSTLCILLEGIEKYIEKKDSTN